MKTNIQILYDMGLIDNYNNSNAYEASKDYVLIQVNERRRPDLEEVSDVIQCFCS